MSDEGRLSAPGDLRPGSLSGPGRLNGAGAVNGTATAVHDGPGPGLPAEPLAGLAAQYGLQLCSARPPVRSYLQQIWQRRHFIVGFATARNIAMYTDAKLGQMWQVLTPLLNAGVYFLIFDGLLHANRGVPNYIAFLVTGVFVFNFTQRSFITASRVMHDSLPLIRALYFPRACLPLGYVIIELQQLMLSFGVLFVIVLVTGEPLTWYWLLVLPALMLQTVFNVGAGLILARWGAGFDDVSQLLPFIIRTWMYVSGVLFSITSLSLINHGALTKHPNWAYVMQINPAAVYITLVRNALLASQRASMPGAKPYNAINCKIYSLYPNANESFSAYCHPIVSQEALWLYGVGWAVVALVTGFLFFWRAEARYGRG